MLLCPPAKTLHGGRDFKATVKLILSRKGIQFQNSFLPSQKDWQPYNALIWPGAELHNIWLPGWHLFFFFFSKIPLVPTNTSYNCCYFPTGEDKIGFFFCMTRQVNLSDSVSDSVGRSRFTQPGLRDRSKVHNLEMPSPSCLLIDSHFKCQHAVQSQTCAWAVAWVSTRHSSLQIQCNAFESCT